MGKTYNFEAELWCVSNKPHGFPPKICCHYEFPSIIFCWFLPTKNSSPTLWVFLVNPSGVNPTNPSQVTHDGPHGIFDLTGGGHWGSSQELLGAIYRIKPKAWRWEGYVGTLDIRGDSLTFNIADTWKMDRLKMYLLLKMVIFQPAVLVYQRVGGGNSNILGIFTPILGEMIQLDEHISSDGWGKTHQLVIVFF